MDGEQVLSVVLSLRLFSGLWCCAAPHWEARCQIRGNGGFGGCIQTMRVAKAASTGSGAIDVIDDVVGTTRCYTSWNEIQIEIETCLPADGMVGAGCVSTNAHGSHEIPRAVIEREATAEHICPTDAPADHVIAGGAIVRDIPAVGHVFIDRIRVLQPKQASTGLRRRVQVSGG